MKIIDEWDAGNFGQTALILWKELKILGLNLNFDGLSAYDYFLLLSVKWTGKCNFARLESK
jgi:hypothetical protein